MKKTGTKKAKKTLKTNSSYNPFKVKLNTCGAVKCVKLWLAFEQACFVCESPLQTWTSFQIDHIIPQSFYVENKQKVNHNFDNLCILCPKCNVRKGKKDAKEFFGNRFAMLATYHAKVDTLSKEAIHAAAMVACAESKMFAKKYQSGIHFAKFHA